MDRDYKIYMHTSPSNKVYIGQTSQDLKRRCGKGGIGYLTKTKKWEYMQPAFANAILKYGWENFKHEILMDGLTADEANYYEEKLIKEYDSTNPKKGYNIKPGGKNSSPSEETRRKMSESSSGENNCLFGKHLPQETKDKISKSRKGKCCGAENHNYGKHLSKDTRDKLSKSHKEYYKNYGHHLNGKKLSDDHRKKISMSKKGKYMGSENKYSKPIYQINLDTGEIVAEFEGVHDAERKTGAIASKISACCVGKRKSHMGYGWVHKDKYDKEKDAE